MFATLRSATPDDVAEFVTWRYDPPFDVYNLTQSLDEAVEYFVSAEVRCHVTDTSEGLGGYCTFGEDGRVPGGDYSAAALDIGAALSPTLTRRGHGTAFVAVILDGAATVFDPKVVRVSIAATNSPALRVWMANGLSETQRFRTQREVLGTTEFVVLEKALAQG